MANRIAAFADKETTRRMSNAHSTKTIALTGANGFIGRHVVAAAVGRGHRVVAIIRPGRKTPSAWHDNDLIEAHEIDLSSSQATEQMTAILARCDAVIHAAASLLGNDATQERTTLSANTNVLNALAATAGERPTLVLVSSLAVYDTRSQHQNATVNEACPLADTAKDRDAYCRAKIAQEQAAIEAAAQHDLSIRIMRPGAVFGPGNLWNGHIGPTLGPIAVRLARGGEVPTTYVKHCATALVLAAELPVLHDDRPGSEAYGRVEYINIVDDDRPTRAQFLNAIQKSGWPRFVIPAAWRPLEAVGTALEYAGLSERVPGLLRPAVLHARIKPLKYCNQRLHDRLQWRPEVSFSEALQNSITTANRDC